MRVPILALAAALTAQAADERQQLTLQLQAESDFQRVESAVAPQPRDTAACIQSQASVLPVAAREERTVILFRKGYCALAAAAMAQDSTQFAAAATVFGEAIEAWPARVAAASKKKLPPPPVPSALRVFAAVSRLEQNAQTGSFGTVEAQLIAAVERPACESTVMAPESCQAAVDLGNLWLGRIAWQRGDASAAARRFSGTPVTGWPRWLEGQEAFDAGDYRNAAARYGEAVEIWRQAERDPSLPLVERLSPRPDMGAILTAFGAAQLLSGNAAAAIETLDAAVKADPSKARAIYLRARAKEAGGQAGAALADYSLASRTAFAAAAGRSSGEAHLYQGILFYQRKDWPRAEDEFADALNFDIPTAMQPDATAWRLLAQVSDGYCGAAREYLERSLAAVSPDFPKDGALAALAACRSL